MSLATVEQQRRGTRAKAVGARAKRYQGEWERELKARGITPNGETWEEQRQQRALAQAKARKIGRAPSPLKCLEASARAWDRARTGPTPCRPPFGPARYVGES